MRRVFLVLMGILLVTSCTASWNHFVTEFEGQQITVSGKLSDTDRILVRINGNTVIRDWIVITRNTGYVEGNYNGHEVKVECHRDRVVNMTRLTFCEVFLQKQKIGELFFAVAGIEF